MLRFTRQFLIAGLGLALFPAAAAAQFAPQFTPALVPPNPLYQLTPYRFQLNLGVTVPTTFGRAFVGWTAPFTPAPQYFSPNYGRPTPRYPWLSGATNTMGYMSGGSAGAGSYAASAQRAFEQAQADATRVWGNPDAKKAIGDQWAYEKIGVAGLAGAEAGQPQRDALLRALAVTSESEVASGEALNHILAAVVSAEAKGGKGVSAFLPPQLLDEVRFAGASADAVNLVRQSGRLPFPAAFATPELRDLRDVLEKDFAAVAAPLLAGKPVEPAKLMKLEATLKKLEEVAPPVIRNQSFEDAIAARRFLNQLASAVRTLKGGATGLVSPAWATEGANVADLVRHMTKHKLQFGPVAPGGEAGYLALHKALMTYLFVLTQPKK
jgi:hypothetical protein